MNILEAWWYYKGVLVLQFQMSTKILQNLTKKLKEGEIIVDILTVYLPTRSQKRYEMTLAICSLSLYLLDGNTLKRTLPIDTIKQLTISTFSNQIVLHCPQQDLWLETCHSVKIIKNILKIREKVLQDTSPLVVALEKEKSLQNFATEESKLRKFWHGVFGKKETAQGDRGERKSYCTLQVRDKDFVLQIGKAIYRCNYKNAQLLYISGCSGFIFNEFDYIRQAINEETFRYQHKETRDYYLMRRIPKCEDEQGRLLRKSLQNYKLEDFNEQILFAVETAQYYEIITPFAKEQKTLEELLNEQRFIPEIDLVSIYYKLVSFIRSSIHPCYSLSPSQVILREAVALSSVFCLNANRTNPNYLAPEELDPTLTPRNDVQTINLWKIGMLLYEAAFLVLPFPVQFLADLVARRKVIVLKFPRNHGRSEAFLDFLSCILVIDPEKRGGGAGWQKSLFNHRWILQCMK